MIEQLTNLQNKCENGFMIISSNISIHNKWENAVHFRLDVTSSF